MSRCRVALPLSRSGSRPVWAPVGGQFAPAVGTPAIVSARYGHARVRKPPVGVRPCGRCTACGVAVSERPSRHAAFDRYLIGIRPDCVVEVRGDILAEADGPMLVHGLQGFHESGLLVPRQPALRPDRELLAARYERFRRAG